MWAHLPPLPPMSWTGKLLGVLVGVLLMRAMPIMGAALGLLLGHAWDAGWLRKPRENPYAELGLEPDASDAEVDLAYRRLMARYHPDRHARASAEQQREAEQRASRINTAYSRIRRQRKR